ncbi:hypothetical protein [Shinella sp.]|uniref:hypothetical protein n=1 Tax=Shinella sp. TaxID=1870904 RepID=UPI003D2D0658
MTLYLEQPSGDFTPWDGATFINDVLHPPNIEQLWAAQDLQAIGLWRDDMIAPAADVPAGKIIVATDVKRVDGIVTFSHTLEDVPVYVPQSVTRRQARLALLAAGLLTAVEAAIEGMDEPARTAAKIEWEDATEIRRDHALIASLAVELNLSSDQLDELFIAASEI